MVLIAHRDTYANGGTLRGTNFLELVCEDEEVILRNLAMLETQGDMNLCQICSTIASGRRTLKPNTTHGMMGRHTSNIGASGLLMDWIAWSKPTVSIIVNIP